MKLNDAKLQEATQQWSVNGGKAFSTLEYVSKIMNDFAEYPVEIKNP